MSNTPETNQPRPTSDTLHNRNCRDYLMYLLAEAPDFLYRALDDADPALPLGSYLQNVKRNGFPETLPYGNMYYMLIPFLEDHPAVLAERENGDENDALHEFIYRLFANANENLQRTYKAIKPVIAAPSNRPLEKRITAHLANDGARINARDPILVGSMLELGLAAISDDYRPMRDNIPSILPFNHNVLQLRFGTMAQKKDGGFRVSPLFQRWLEVAAVRHNRRHLYINHLAWDRPGLDPEGDREVAMSMALHGNPNLDVITLPADKGLMEGHEYTRTTETLSKKEVFNDLLDIADNTKNPALDRKYPIRDLNIPPDLSEQIFGDDRRGILKELLKQSFRECGLADRKQHISCAQRQAVWVHFIDFALTNHIIKQLNPASVNISCKDAIDRGGLASAVFNLMYSVRTGNTPLTREQFEMLVDAPATMVKGRGMNNHRNRLWNMLDVWVNANFALLDRTPQCRWIIAWRDDNCPSARAAEVLDERITKARAQSMQGPDILWNVIGQVETLAAKGISDRRLLLRVISSSCALVQGADKEAHANYEKLIDRIAIDSRLAAAGRLLSGAMKTLLGVVSFSSQRIQKGMGTFRSGFYFSERREMTAGLRRIKHEMEPVENAQTGHTPPEHEDNDDSDDGSLDLTVR